ncbi:MAG: MMPL family transporter [Oscillospiraceae bacterium]|nr:MMPL family transporter [Oscillospiraceae bacterium]
MSTQKKKETPIEKLAALIVDKRKAFYLFYIIAGIFCAISTGWTQVNNDITSYLPDSSETRMGLDLMNEQFITYGSGSIMLENVTYEKAEQIAAELEEIDGVTSVTVSNDEDSYKNGSALLSVTFDGEEDDQISKDAMNAIKQKLEPYDVYISSAVGNSSSETIAAEMQVVIVIVLVIIIAVLFFTSHTYMEIPVLLMTFGMAALLNMGTNFLFGEISFVSNSIAVVLQLALAIDYAIILCNRYTEERVTMGARDAVVTALSKAIPEISSSCLTTLSGMVAMMLMQFKLGLDLGMVLCKAIFFSIFVVFTLMPGLLMSFSPLIDKTHHRSFVPNITAVGKLDVKTRFVVPPVFAVILAAGFILSNQTNYVYGYSTLTTFTKNASQIAEEKINSEFGSNNLVVVMVPAGNYEKEHQLLERIEQMPQVDSTLGLANIEAMAGYVLTDSLTPRQFAELTDMDIEVVQLAYAAYAADQEDYGKIVGSVTNSSFSNYSVPLIDMFGFIYEEKQAGYVSLGDELNETIDDLHDQLEDAKKQLGTDEYSRMLLFTNVPEEGEETFAFLDELHNVVQQYYPDGSYVVGDSTSDYDLSSVFSTDNLMVSILSFLFVLVILVFTFKSAGLPVLLLAIIQGAIWINFSVPVIMDTNIFFLSYLIVSSIQMGANIDYAIVISSRYTELKKEMSIKDAMVETLNQAFPTIITSGAILAIAGLLIGFLSSDVAISSVGICLGRGTLISIGLVMFVLPQILLLGDTIIEKTSFTLRRRESVQKRSGYMRVNGRVRGYVCGIVDANISGMIHGEISAQLDSDAAESMREKVDRQIINHIDADGKHIGDISSAAPFTDTAEDADDIMDETED